MKQVLSRAREMLENLTPLKSDCGRVCGAACCRPLQEKSGEMTGMLLFPGEEEAYTDPGQWTIRSAPQGLMVVCSGFCRREERPLSCRIFPLLPVFRNGEIRAVTDLRAKAVCPLARQGRAALDPAFREAVREAGEYLATDAEQAHFLHRLTEEQEELKRLRAEFGGNGHV